MTLPSFAAMKCWKLTEDWPHRPSVDALITSMGVAGYSSEAIVKAVRFIVAFVEHQNKRSSGEPPKLHPADIDQFIAGRLSAGAIENGNRVALRRLRTELVRAGILSPPAENTDPAERVVSLYVMELRRRGYSKQSIGTSGRRAAFFGLSGLTMVEFRSSHTVKYGTIWQRGSMARRANHLLPGSLTPGAEDFYNIPNDLTRVA